LSQPFSRIAGQIVPLLNMSDLSDSSPMWVIGQKNLNTKAELAHMVTTLRVSDLIFYRNNSSKNEVRESGDEGALVLSLTTDACCV
jgi:hypothetical protein